LFTPGALPEFHDEKPEYGERSRSLNVWCTSAPVEIGAVPGARRDNLNSCPNAATPSASMDDEPYWNLTP
jgi:hypothetical protein